MNKQTLVILPGWCGSKETWQKFINLAEKKYKVVCLNLPCFGDQPCPKEIWGVEDYSEYVKKQIKKHLPDSKTDEDSKIVLLGHSFGGQVAVQLAANHPELIDKLILSGPAVIRPKRGLRRIFFNIVAKVGKLVFKLPLLEKFDVLAKKLLYRAADSPDYVKTSGVKREIFKKIIRQDLSHLLPKISAKTLVIWGAFDGYLPVKNGKKIAKLIPNARLEIVKNGRHGLHIQQPKKFFEIIDKFLI